MYVWRKTENTCCSNKLVKTSVYYLLCWWHSSGIDSRQREYVCSTVLCIVYVMAMEMTDELLTGQKVTKAHLDIAERPPVEHVMSYTYGYVRHADSWPLACGCPSKC